MKRLLGAAVAAGVFTVASAASAQSGASQSAVALNDTAASPALAPAPQYPRFGRSTEYSLGFRTWMFIVPSWMVGLFASVNDWSGVLNVAAGPEFVLRRGDLDIVVGLQYTGFQAPVGYFHGSSEQDIATERVDSNLWAIYGNVLFLWHVRINDWFEFQPGVGIGLGYVGGTLNRTQVYPSGTGGYNECDAMPPPGGTPPFPTRGGYCDTANNHYLYNDGTRYSEGRLTDNGNIPPVIPWISLPHLALHFRPHRNVDVRLDGGFALVGFYTGLAAHYVF